MNNLDNISAIKKLDQGKSLESIRQLPDQCKQAWEESTALCFPQSFKNVASVVICGMGGSSYGARIVKSLYDGTEMAKIPVELVNNYWLPGYVKEDSLVILSSYSGNTEETLSVARQARKKSARIIGITSGGDLAGFLRSYGYPAYIFNPLYNPSKQPRMGVGYMLMGLIGFLSKLQIIPVDSPEIKKLVAFLQEQTVKFDSSVLKNINPAKQLAVKLKGKIPVFMVADFLEGAAYAVRNPFHETAKQFALYFSIPQANHHLMEGLGFPGEIKNSLLFVFITSFIYDKRNSKRLELTREVVKKNGIETETIVLSGYSALTQTMEFIQIGAWTTFYLAMLNNVDPAKIPWVDYFKANLSSRT